MKEKAKFVLMNLAAGALSWAGGELAKYLYASLVGPGPDEDRETLARIEDRLDRIEKKLGP